MWSGDCDVGWERGRGSGCSVGRPAGPGNATRHAAEVSGAAREKELRTALTMFVPKSSQVGSPSGGGPRTRLSNPRPIKGKNRAFLLNIIDT